MVTCPSPAKTTLPFRRTHKIVVERIFLLIDSFTCGSVFAPVALRSAQSVLNLHFSTAKKVMLPDPTFR
jgi:hypothetical protein